MEETPHRSNRHHSHSPLHCCCFTRGGGGGGGGGAGPAATSQTCHSFVFQLETQSIKQHRFRFVCLFTSGSYSLDAEEEEEEEEEGGGEGFRLLDGCLRGGGVGKSGIELPRVYPITDGAATHWLSSSRRDAP